MVEESGHGYAVILNLGGKKQEGVHYDETGCQGMHMIMEKKRQKS